MNMDEINFENLSHFYSSFKEKFGVTPSMITDKLSTTS